MARLTFPFENARVHLAVEGSTGGTTLGLHMAADAIKHGGRVLWASPEMPDGVRFGQLFEHLSLADSSKFHAMNLVGSLSQAVDVLVQTSTALPSVRLIVLDDWCAQSGRIPSDRIQTKGYGMSVPLNTNSSEQERALNRRTELKIIAVE